MPPMAENEPQRWCSSEAPGITLREMKHSYPGGNRVLSLLVLESAAPRGFAGAGRRMRATGTATTGSELVGGCLIKRAP